METNTTSREELLRYAREQGRQEAEAFDLRLTDLERREREERLAKMAWKPHRPAASWDDEEASFKLLQLQGRVEELGDYLRAIENSVAWRAIQGVRRLFGRAW